MNTELPNIYAETTIAVLVALVKANVNDGTTRTVLQELRRRGVSVVGIIPTSHAPERTTGRYVETPRGPL